MTNEENNQPSSDAARRFLRPEAWGLYMRTAWNKVFGLKVSRISDDLYVGGQFAPEQWPRLHALGIRAVLSLQEEYEDRFAGQPPERTLRVLVPDFQAPSQEQLSEAVGFIEACHADGLPVMVHCHAGMGRAPLTAAAYLIKQGSSVEAALKHITEQRPIVGLNAVQLQCLYAWEKLLSKDQR